MDERIFGLVDYGIHEATQFEPGLYEVGRVEAGDGFL
jgi:hypothetical protein